MKSAPLPAGRRARFRQLVSPSQTVEDEAPRMDLRALWAVAGAWPAAWLLVRQPPGAASVAAVLGAALVALLAWRLLLNRGLLAWLHSLWGPAAAAAAGATLVAGGVAIHQLADSDPILEAVVSAGETVRFEAVVLESPRTTSTRAAPWSEDVEPVATQPPATQPPATQPLATQPPEAELAGRDSAQAAPQEHPGTTLLVDVLLDRYTDQGRWRSTSARAVLVLDSGAAQLTSAGPGVGDRLSGLGEPSPGSNGSRERLWLRAAGPVVVQVGTATASPVEQARGRFAEMAGVLPGDGPALLPGMVMGDRSGQSEELGEAMKMAGLVHLTAVSGANCAMVLGAVMWLARATGMPRAPAFLASLAALAGFVVLVHPEPSVVRAASMGAIAAIAVYAGRGKQATAALGACVVVLLVWDPWYAGEPAFQLSVLATAGIVLLGRPLALVARKVLPGWLADGVAIGLAAQLACLPVLVGMDATVAVYAVPANMAVAPLVPLVTVAGTAGLVLAVLPGPFAVPLVWVAGLPAALVGGLGRWVAGLPGASAPWPQGVPGVAAALIVALLAGAAVHLALGRAPLRQRILASLLAVASAALPAGLLVPATGLLLADAGPWDVAACDVGQGDALVLRTSAESALIVDTGPDPDLMDECLDRLGVRNVPALFITHLHADHSGGIAGVLEGRNIEKVHYSSSDPAAGVPGLSHGIPATRLFEGDAGSAGEVGWTVIAPAREMRTDNENDASLVVAFSLTGPAGGPDLPRPVTLLATGDIEEAAMDDLLRRRPGLRTDILKVSHHGARNGGSAVIETVRPRLALISVGRDNTYGHPAPQTLEALALHRVPAFRTDVSGTVLLRLRDDGGIGVFGWGSGAAGAGR